MEEILLFAQIFVLLPENLRGLALKHAMLFVNDSTDLNDPKTSWWYISKTCIEQTAQVHGSIFHFWDEKTHS